MFLCQKVPESSPEHGHFTSQMQLDTMRGERKSRATRFKKGFDSRRETMQSFPAPVYREVIARAGEEDFKTVTVGSQMTRQPIISLDEEGRRVDYTALRPKKSTTFIDDYESRSREDGHYAMYHNGRLIEFITTVVNQHTSQSPGCQADLSWTDQQSEKRGLAWAQSVCCNRCGYVSGKTKLYEEVCTGRPGRKAAKPNVGVQVGLARQGISASGFADILSSANIPPPSTSGLQRAANKVNPVLIEENQLDMSSIRRELKRRNLLLGKRHDDPINVEADGTYNNRIGSAWGKTPMQPATQATYMVAENITPEKKIIAARTYSKICNCDVKYGVGPHREHCTANLRPDAVIGNESLYLEDCIGDIQTDDISIQYITLDGDSSARCTCDDVKNPRSDVEIRAQYCIRHLSRTLQAKCNKVKFSPSMFSGKHAERTYYQTLFSQDLARRVTAEFSEAFSYHGPAVPILKNRMANLYEALILCYMGDCSKCDQHSFVCSSEDPWRRPYISTLSKLKSVRAFIHPSSEDKTKLREVLDIRLSDAAVDKTFMNTTQNKCEAANRGVIKAVPKHITFSRNYHGRVHAAVHSMNNGPGTSLLKLCDAVGAPIPTDSRVVPSLKQLDHAAAKNKQRKKSTAYKIQRATKRSHRYEMYGQKERNVKSYRRAAFALDDLLRKEHSYSEQSTPTEKDHAYPLRQRRRRPVQTQN